MKFLKLPIVIAFLVSGALIGFAFWGQTNNTTHSTESDTPKLKAVISDTNKDDSDSDGLADWEEVLWQTDPKNPDTDGDGTKDNDEIKQNRNPLVKGPGDSLVTKEDVAANIPKQKAGPLDLLSQDLLKKYLSLKQTGQPLSSEDATRIADSISKSIDTLPMEKTSYIYSDIKTIPDNPQEIRNYGNILGKTFIDFFPKEYGQEVVILERALKNQDPKVTILLSSAILGYSTIQKNMLNQPVPKSALVVHTALLNAITHQKEVVVSLKETFDNPILGLQALKTWKNTVTEVKNTLDDLSFYFQDQDIVFNKNEYGRTFDSSVE